jgi:LysR family transcriptional regulator, regulator for genes of the gallate degradation pathway
MSRLSPSLRQLGVFLELARGRSVSAAAGAVHLSQPAVSQILARLETACGARLFERTGRGLELTAAGELLRLRAQRAREQVRDGLAEAGYGKTPQRRGAAADPARAMTTAQFQALAAVAGHGGFAAAARATGQSRPSLHRAVRQLERRLGIALVETTTFGVRPTREAQRLARRVRLAFAEVAQARAEIDALGGVDSGRTVIGAMPLSRSGIVPAATLEFCAQHPGHEVAMLEGAYETLLDALCNGRADVLVGALRERVPAADVEQQHLFDDPLAIVVRAGHPLAAGRAPDTRSLAAYPWIVSRAGSPLRRRFEELFERARLVPPGAVIECNSMVAARELLLGSDRVTLLSARQVSREIAAGLLVAMPHPQGRVTRPIGLTVRRSWHPTAAQHALIEALRRQASADEAGTVGCD